MKLYDVSSAISDDAGMVFNKLRALTESESEGGSRP